MEIPNGDTPTIWVVRHGYPKDRQHELQAKKLVTDLPERRPSVSNFL